jgi:hypothetical protein
MKFACKSGNGRSIPGTISRGRPGTLSNKSRASGDNSFMPLNSNFRLRESFDCFAQVTQLLHDAVQSWLHIEETTKRLYPAAVPRC